MTNKIRSLRYQKCLFLLDANILIKIAKNYVQHEQTRIKHDMYRIFTTRDVLFKAANNGAERNIKPRILNLVKELAQVRCL